MRFGQIFLDIADLMFPNFCLLCQRKLAKSPLCYRCLPLTVKTEDLNLCNSCFTKSDTIDHWGVCKHCKTYPLIFSQMRYLWEYNDHAQKVITYLKYKPSLRLSKYIANYLSQKAETLFSNNEFDLIIPVPASRIGIKERGFSHTAIMAKALSKTFLVETTTKALIHKGYKNFQASLTTEERLDNVKGAFYANTDKVKDKKILLIDDVVTTGATSTNAAIELINAGADSVSLLFLARSETWHTMRARLNSSLIIAKESLYPSNSLTS